jgi:carbon-monoxide dehydrogenase medium subunit
MKPAPFRYDRPASLEAALELLSRHEGARPIAGGQSLGPMLNLRAATPELLVDISRLPELRRIDETDGAIVVGAAVRHADFEDGRVPDIFGNLLGRVARGIAYRAVRNRGTIGGSLAHADPAADWPPVMVALGAAVETRSTAGSRTVAASDLMTGALTTSLGPGELLEAIHIPRFDRKARAGYHKIAIKPGDFAESFAIIIDDPARGALRAVLSGKGQPPLLMRRTIDTLSRTGGPGSSMSAVKQSVHDDLEAGGILQTISPYELALHQTSMVRAAREMWSAA